ncbi:MAG: UDP-3-O-(3-hydroxymyristoyl)glucosamine N-acyltransferase [Acidobacteria bacterium]|nr:UDP-3-O-(3-hydroxymyristoyl)glucosamine N-acyltransferase [Acidobacteriota bacterium]
MKTEKTVNDLARLVGGKAEGATTRIISGVAPLENAGEGDASFLESERNLTQAIASRAGCLVAPPGLDLPKKTVIRVRNPRYGFAQIIQVLFPPPPRRPEIHPTAQISDNVTLGTEVAIGPYAVIGEGSRIGSRSSIGAGCVLGEKIVLGEDCLLYPRVTLYAGTRIGCRVILHSGCVVGGDGFGYVMEAGQYHKFPQIGGVEIADDVEIGSNSTVDRGALEDTRIGRGTKIDNLVQVGHTVQIGANCVVASQTGISGSSVIEDYVVIAGQVGLGDHARVQKGAILGGQCGILPHKTVRAGQTVWGTPARPLREQLEQQALVARLPQLLQKLGALRTRNSTETARKNRPD